MNKKRHRGLGKLQKKQRLATETKILDHLGAGGEKWAWVRSINRATKIETKTLLKTLNRMVTEEKIVETGGTHNSRLFCLPNSILAERIKARIERKRQIKKDSEKYTRKQKRKFDNWLIYANKDNPKYVRSMICDAIFKIEYEDENENKVLKQTKITKKSYESWIKRSPRLTFIRKKLREYRKQNKSVSKLWYVLCVTPIWAKRLLKNPKKYEKEYSRLL